MIGPDERPRTQIVDHGSACYAARRSPLQGLDNFPAVIVGQPDIKQDVNVFGRRIYVGHHRLNRGVRIRKQMRRVAADGPERADGMPKPKEISVAAWHGRVDA